MHYREGKRACIDWSVHCNWQIEDNLLLAFKRVSSVQWQGKARSHWIETEYEWCKSKDSEYRLFFKKVNGKEKMCEVQL